MFVICWAWSWTTCQCYSQLCLKGTTRQVIKPWREAHVYNIHCGVVSILSWWERAAKCCRLWHHHRDNRFPQSTWWLMDIICLTKRPFRRWIPTDVALNFTISGIFALKKMVFWSLLNAFAFNFTAFPAAKLFISD